eukprot:TRINITY_DN940_c0_g1_i5.p1 TRINITY_DN940_c0_g1~~TRINITY_DN940_c0_g1_i5.p1  ORF type:complete len:747 (-),score=181.27 TRINITY_DN940_c0_g1_i5:1487-3727(-)
MQTQFSTSQHNIGQSRLHLQRWRCQCLSQREKVQVALARINPSRQNPLRCNLCHSNRRLLLLCHLRRCFADGNIQNTIPGNSFSDSVRQRCPQHQKQHLARQLRRQAIVFKGPSLLQEIRTLCRFAQHCSRHNIRMPPGICCFSIHIRLLASFDHRIDHHHHQRNAMKSKNQTFDKMTEVWSLSLPSPTKDVTNAVSITSSLSGFPHSLEIQAAGLAYFQLMEDMDDLDTSTDEDGVSSSSASKEADSQFSSKVLADKYYVSSSKNYYELLGLQEDAETRYTYDEIKSAYRKQVLLHHPDKQRQQSETTKPEPEDNELANKAEQTAEGDDDEDPQVKLFRDIQEAFECLSNPHARRVYESQRPFDDRIPRAGPMDENDFYETYGPVFARNGKFSCKRPVPSLGDESTPYEQVDDFYVFWFHFETWRDFSEYYEFQLEDAEDRDEKRWMAVQNTADGKRMLKKEKKRIRQLTEQAFSIDPRLRRREQQRKEAREKAVEERRLKKEKAKREKEEAEAERKRIEEKELKEKKAITKKLDKRAKNARRKIRKSVTAALEDSEVQDQDLIACAGSDDNVALLTKNLPLESMEQLVEEFQTNGNMAGLTKFQQLVDELNQDKQEAVEKIEQAKPQSKAEKIISNEDNWSIEEMGKFAKAIRKYVVHSSSVLTTHKGTYLIHHLSISTFFAHCLLLHFLNSDLISQSKHKHTSLNIHLNHSFPLPPPLPRFPIVPRWLPKQISRYRQLHGNTQ